MAASSPSSSSSTCSGSCATTTGEEDGCNYSHIISYLTGGAYPNGADKAMKNSIRKRSKFFVMEAGHLHYVGGKLKKKPRLVVQDLAEQQRLIETTHNTAHFGRDKTLSVLNERYYWPDMYKQICAYVSV